MGATPPAASAPRQRQPVDVSVVTSGHDVADARLHREVAALLRAGCTVEVLGLGVAADGPGGADVRTWPRPGPAGRAGLAASMAGRARGRVLMTLDPDSALAAAAAVLVSGRTLVVDVHEDYARLLQDRAWARAGGGLPGRAARSLVRAFTAVARKAALTVVADDHLPPTRARRRFVLRNAPDPAMLPTPTEPAAVPRALYVGDLRASRGLFVMLEALAAAPAWHLDLVGPVAAADQARLDELLAADPALTARVHLHGRRPPTRAWEHARGAWCGLLPLADTPAFREAMPSKLDEYLSCGLAVVTTDLPRPGERVTSSGAGVLVPAFTVDAAGPPGTPDDDAAAGGRRSGGGPGSPAAAAAAIAAHLNAWAADPATLAPLRAAALAARPTGPSPYDEFAAQVLALLPRDQS